MTGVGDINLVHGQNGQMGSRLKYCINVKLDNVGNCTVVKQENIPIFTR